VSQPVRIGIIGYGSVASGPYTRQIQRMQQMGYPVEVIQICDVSEDRRQVARDRLGVESFTSAYQDVIDNEQVDVVLVTTSMVEHGPIAKAALQAGKHVLVEKPMAVELEEAAELVEISKSSPGYLVCAPHVILSPTFQTMWQRIHSGELGKIRLARAFYGWAGPSWGQWFYRRGGGALFDLGVYNVTSLTALLGPAQRVTALAGTTIKERVVDDEMMKVEAVDNAHVLIDFGEGVYAVVTTGFTIQKYRVPAIELYGDKGTIQMMGDDWDPDGYELWLNDVGAWQLHGETDPNWPWTDGLRHLVDCIQSGTRPIIQPEHAYHVLEIMLKAEAAGRDGQAREIESTFTPPRFFSAEKEQELAHLIHDRTQL
jgi:predicted dehydrogenase